MPFLNHGLGVRVSGSDTVRCFKDTYPKVHRLKVVKLNNPRTTAKSRRFEKVLLNDDLFGNHLDSLPDINFFVQYRIAILKHFPDFFFQGFPFWNRFRRTAISLSKALPNLPSDTIRNAIGLQVAIGLGGSRLARKISIV